MREEGTVQFVCNCPCPPFPPYQGHWFSFLEGIHPGTWRRLSKKECKLSCLGDGTCVGKAEAFEGIIQYL